MALMAQHAGAVTLSPQGIGQALVFPYYTVNRNQDTLLSVTNTSDVGKAIQVRFREGLNGRDAFSFALFLGAHDTWTGAVSAHDEGAVINTSDRSCVLSPMVPDVATFRTAAFDDTGLNPPDGGPQDISRTREGFFEMIVGGDVKPGSATATAISRRPDLNLPTCDVDAHAFVNDLVTPTDGIFGSAIVVDVAQGTFFGYNADALQGIADHVMFKPGNPYPGPELNDASDNEGAAGTARAYVATKDGRGIALDYLDGIDAVSAVFMADAIYNDYIASDSLGAATDWIVTFPTRQFYVDNLYGNAAKKPFDNFVQSGESPVVVGGRVLDREQLDVAFDGECAGNCPPAILRYQVNAIGFGGLADDSSSRVLGSNLVSTFMPLADESGHALLWLDNPDRSRVLAGGIDSQSGHEVWLHGLPVTAFMAYNIVNASASPGVLANYSGAFPHRRTTASENLF